MHYFLHIPKAGGSTFLSILNNMYKQDEMIDLYTSEPDWRRALKELENLNREEKTDLSIVRGHFFYGIHELFPQKDFKYITFLRHPLERIVSLYYFILRSDQHYLFKDVSNTMSLSDFAQSNLSWEIDNGMVRQIVGKDNLKEKCTDTDLMVAKERINKNFSFVGITERYNESLVCLRNSMNWEKQPLYMIVNQTKKKGKLVDERVKDVVLKRNAYDLELYKWADNQLSNKLKNIPNLNTQLEFLRIANDSFSEGYSLGNKNGYRQGFAEGAADYKEKLLKKYPFLKLKSFLFPK